MNTLDGYPNLQAVHVAIKGARTNGLGPRLIALIHTDDLPAFRAEMERMMDEEERWYPTERTVGPVVTIDGIPVFASHFNDKGVVRVVRDPRPLPGEMQPIVQ